MSIIYEARVRRGGQLVKPKIEIKEVINDCIERGISCEIDEEKLPYTGPEWEIWHFKKIENCADFIVWLRAAGLEDCADKVEQWIRQAGGKGEERG